VKHFVGGLTFGLWALVGWLVSEALWRLF